MTDDLKTNMTTQQLIEQLITEGGAIVSSNDCSEIELAGAQAEGRFAVDEDGMGFVRRMKIWLMLQKQNEKAICEIKLETDGLIDGAPDRSAVASLADRVYALAEGKP